MLNYTWTLNETMLWLLLWSPVLLLTDPSLADPVPFLTVLNEDASSIKDCQEPGLKSCVKVQVDFEAFYHNSSLLFPGGVPLDRSLRIDGPDGSFYCYKYKALGTSTTILTLTNSENFKALSGTINLAAKGYYTLENCGKNCHVLARQSDAKMRPTGNDVEDWSPSPRITGVEHDRLLELGKGGGRVIITVQIYYTPDFKKVTSNMESFFNNEVNLANVGYEQSKIEMRLKIKCIKGIDLTEPNEPNWRIQNFRSEFETQKRKNVDLFLSADIAVLYTATPVYGRNNSVHCGQVFAIDSINYDYPPIAWVSKNCVNTLAHEIGHMFGARHERNRDNLDDVYMDAHGFAVRGGFHTIMAMGSSSHPTGIDYYSNTIQTFQGESMGDSRSNNRQVLQLNRFVLAAKGDERTSCSGVRFAEIINPPETGSCENRYSDDICCQSVNQGYCTKGHAMLIGVMKYQCARSCRYCCADSVQYGGACSLWASLGFCTQHKVDFMNCNCPKTCGFCTP